MNTTAQGIQERYATLAEDSCCLSCGTAVGRCEPKPGEVCVDLGSGRGTDVLWMAEQVGPSGHAYGIDLTEAMLATARRTASKMGVENATFLRADLEALPLPSGIAHWVTSNCVLNHAGDKGQVWREIARVLRDEGRFVVSDIYAAVPIDAKYRNDPQAVAECWGGAVVREEYLRHIAEAGLVDVEILEESEPYPKGQAQVVSFTIAGRKPRKAGCCCS